MITGWPAHCKLGGNAPAEDLMPVPRYWRAAAVRRTIALAVLGTITTIAALGTPLMAQATATATAPAPQDKRLFVGRDAMIAAGFALATVALFPVDRAIAQELQSPAAQANERLRNAARGFELIASPGAYYIGGGLYLAGRIGRMDRLADLGLHGTEAVILAEGIGYVLKRVLGRARPYVSGATDPQDFSLGAGFGTGDRRAFPSGHTYTAFAAAAAVTSETRRWWPRSTWVVAPIMYGGATLVGLSRMYNNQHWASDIVLGAAVGTFSGLKVVHYVHANPDNRVDRLLLRHTTAAATADGARLGLVYRW